MRYHDHSDISLESLFPHRSRGMELSDFLIRLDLIGNLAGADKVEIPVMLQRTWSDFFSQSLPLNSLLLDSCCIYFEKYRFGYKLLSNGDDIQRAMIILKITAATAVLLCLSRSGNDTVQPTALSGQAFEMIQGVIDDDSAASQRIAGILSEYFRFGPHLSPDTFRILRAYDVCLQGVLDKLLAMLSSKRASPLIMSPASSSVTQHEARRAEPFTNSPAVSLDTPYDYARAVCLLCAALPKQGREKPKAEAIQEQWTRAFPEIPYSDQVRVGFDQLLAKTPFLSQLDMLFRYPIKDIRNDRIARQIAICLCVNQVLSRLAHNSPADLVMDEALNLFEQFDVLSLGKEEIDVNAYLSLLGADGCCVDVKISRLFWDYAEDISCQFRKSLQEINSKEGVRRRYWESRLGEKNKLVDELQKQVDETKIGTIYSIVEKMSSPEYDYMLSRLYRFAYGFDSLPEDQLRALIKRFFQILRLFEVQPSVTDGIGKPISFACDQGKNVIVEPVYGMEEGSLVFPGWNVSDTPVILPVGCRAGLAAAQLSKNQE